MFLKLIFISYLVMIGGRDPFSLLAPRSTVVSLLLHIYSLSPSDDILNLALRIELLGRALLHLWSDKVEYGGGLVRGVGYLGDTRQSGDLLESSGACLAQTGLFLCLLFSVDLRNSLLLPVRSVLLPLPVLFDHLGLELQVERDGLALGFLATRAVVVAVVVEAEVVVVQAVQVLY